MGNFIEEPIVFTSVWSEKNKAKDIVYILHLNNSWLGDNSINYSLAEEQVR